VAPAVVFVFAVPVRLITFAVALVMVLRVEPDTGDISRILLLLKSATYRLVPSVVMPTGKLNDAPVAAPSLAPAVVAVFAAPVRLITFAVALVMVLRVEPDAGDISRILLLFLSTTYRLVPSVVMSAGLENDAPVAVPSWAPAVVAVFAAPVRLVTFAVALVMVLRVDPDAGDISRILLFELSATYRLVPSVVMPSGQLNVAAVPVPSVAPDTPESEPASVVVAPVAITTLRIRLLTPHSVT